MFKSSKSMAALAVFTSSACAIKFRPPAGNTAEPWHEGPKLPEWVDPKDHPVNYFVPNFGADNDDINTTKTNMAAAEASLGHVMQASFDPPATPPRNYFVPHFGEDEDILATKKHTAAAEKALGHVMSTDPPPADPPRNYFVPHFGED
jgi:hypothetical protein